MHEFIIDCNTYYYSFLNSCHSADERSSPLAHISERNSPSMISLHWILYCSSDLRLLENLPIEKMEHIKLIYITMFVTHNWVSISIIKYLLGNSFTTYTEYSLYSFRYYFFPIYFSFEF